MNYIIFLIIVFFIFLYLYIINIFPKKRIVTVDSAGISIFIISLLINKNLSDINKIIYKEIFDKYIELSTFFNCKKEFINMYDFEKIIWSHLTKSCCFEDYYKVSKLLSLVANGELNHFLSYTFINIHKLIISFYKIYKDSKTKEDFISKLVIFETLLKAYQVSLIMKIDLNIVIKRLRIVRNLKIFDKKNNKTIITRQVKYPMVGSEVCPFINYINIFPKTKINFHLNYSILIIKKDKLIKMEQYLCREHESCIVYKGKNNIIKHIEECKFWYNDKYWENKYPIEKEIIN
jgi:hypothetical protein